MVPAVCSSSVLYSPKRASSDHHLQAQTGVDAMDARTSKQATHTHCTLYRPKGIIRPPLARMDAGQSRQQQVGFPVGISHTCWALAADHADVSNQQARKVGV
jgi:hypothetical protein